MNAESSPVGGHRVRQVLSGKPTEAPARILAGERFGRLFVTAAVVCVAALVALLVMVLAGVTDRVWIVSLGGVSLISLGVLLHFVWHELFQPMRALREWVVGMCSGELSTRLETPGASEFARLAFHVNRLSSALDVLANDMDDVVNHQTERLAHKNRSIEVLYEVAATLNEQTQLDGMLRVASRRLVDLVGGVGAVARDVDERGWVADETTVLCGFDDGLTPVGKPVELLAASNTRAYGLAGLGYDHCVGRSGGVIRIPLRYRQRAVGVIDLFVAEPLSAESETDALFDSVGKHLGMAIEKSRLDAESQTLVRVHERTALAHELHDSLAQTLVGLRMQVKMLSETLLDADVGAARREAARIALVVDEAHTELRELLANFTAPVDDRGLMPVLHDFANRARRDGSPATIAVQLEGPEPALGAATQMQVLRIVGEAITNARKHAHANIIRVLVRHVPPGDLTILIEDDGIGIGERILDARAGENLGLSIMRERAQRIGGELNVESEPGEGTRVELTLPATAGEKEC
jgi:two-component system nitrate/nitrite sensor histidine kinase NarX